MFFGEKRKKNHLAETQGLMNFEPVDKRVL